MRRPVPLAVAAVLVAFAAGAVDYAVTVSKVPDIPPECPTGITACNDARNMQFQRRIDRIIELERGLEGRAWLYALLAAGGAAVALVPWLRSPAPGEERRAAFRELGVAAVVLAILVTVVLSVGDQSVEYPAVQMYIPSGALAVIAGLGGVATRLRSPPERGADPGARARRLVAVGGFAATAVTVVLVLIFMGPQPECGGSDLQDEAPGWTAAVGTAAELSALLALAAGAIALFMRGWFVALVCFVVNPFAILFMIASTCAFY